MNKKNAIIRAAFIILIILAITGIPVVKAYTITLKGSNSGNPNNAIVPSIYWLGICTANLSTYMTAGSSGSFSLSEKWLSPYNTLIGYSTPTYTSNITCKLQNNIPLQSSTSLNDFYMGVFNSTYSGQTSASYLKVTYDCEPDATDYFTYNNTWYNDSLGNHPYGYKYHGSTCFHQTPTQCGTALASSVNDVINVILNGHDKDCPSTITLNKDTWNYNSGVLGNCAGVQSDAAIDEWVLVPFNSMDTGQIILNISPSAGKLPDAFGTTTYFAYQYFLYDTVLNTTENLGTTNPYNIIKNIIPNRDYWLFIGTQIYMDNYQCGSADVIIRYFHTNYTLKIWAYSPAWSCSEWSECNSSIRQRTCIDPAGKVSNKIETESCADISSVIFLNNLGFENSYDTLSQICTPGYFCSPMLYNITVKYPKNWTATSTFDNNTVARENWMTMTNEGGSREGTRSLKMWYIPPKDWEPIVAGSDLTGCGNLTSGRFPEVDTPYNDTLFLAATVSFPSEFMDIRYSVKKCATPQIQYDITPNNICELFIPGKRYYTGGNGYYYSTNTTTYGKYGLRITDTSDDSLIIDIYGEAFDNWADYVADLSNRGLKAGHNYTLAIAVNPMNQQDPYSSCIYVDKIQATIRMAGIGKCESYCDSNYTRYEVISSDPCIYRAAPSSICVAESTDAEGIQNIIEGVKSYECIGTSAWYYNNMTGTLIETPNAPLCVSESEAKKTAAPSTYQDYLDATLYSIPWMASLLILILMVALPVLLAIYGSGAGEMWPLPLFGIAQFIFVCSLNGILPLYFAVMIAVIAAAILAVFISKTVRGG